jgi:hypothetical protein
MADRGGIDWRRFRTDYVSLDTGVRKRLRLTNWRQSSVFDRPGLLFDVTEEDSVQVNKSFSITSRRLIRALKPIIQRADEQGRKAISVTILRTGDGFDTAYQVEEHA